MIVMMVLFQVQIRHERLSHVKILRERNFFIKNL